MVAKIAIPCARSPLIAQAADLGGLFRNVLLGLATLCCAACVTVDHNAAASLGTAGMQATQILSSQASGAIQTLGELNQWWAVHDTLVCLSAKADLQQGCADGAAKERPDPSRQKLIDVLNKREQAIDTLNQAYSAFVDLAHYNAGQEATSALNTTFTDINGFLSAVTAISGGTVPAISSTVGKVTAGVVGSVADNRQNAQILAANKDLATIDWTFSERFTKRRLSTSRMTWLRLRRRAKWPRCSRTSPTRGRPTMQRPWRR